MRVRIENPRLAVAPMEGNAVLVIPGGDGDDYDVTAYVSTQMPHGARAAIARIFGLDKKRVRVIAPFVGGAFGGKAGLPVEHTVAVAVARRLGRPVKATETRSEAMLSMQGRGQVEYVELGLTEDGRFTGLRCRIVGDCGAYAGFGGTFAYSTTYIMATGVYDIPKLNYAGVAALTNTAPVGAFRGAGRPEAAAMIERLVDVAADELGHRPGRDPPPQLHPARRVPLPHADRAHLRLRRLRPAAARGAADRRLRRAARGAGRRREAGDPLLLGIGVAVYAEITGGGSGEYGFVGVADDGMVTVRAGTSSHGQGHATAFSMLVADRFDIPMERIRFEQSDTAMVPRGAGTGGSRSLQVGGSAVSGAADVVLEQARRVAGTLLEASVADIELDRRPVRRWPACPVSR